MSPREKVQAQEPEQAQDEQPIPDTFPQDQLFVAVSEGYGEYAGHDGGPTTGGRGLWATGAVGQWTSRHPVPLALRDPDSGLIWKGYLEPVTQTAFGPQGQTICITSQKFYARPGDVQPQEKPKVATKAVAPTPRATKRATHGPAPLDAGIAKPGSSPLLQSANGRVSDALVG